MMNLQKNSKLLGAVIGLLTLSTLIYSCKKSDHPSNQEGPATVFINLLGAESSIDGLVPSGIKSAKLASVNALEEGATGGRSYHSGAVMTKVISFSNNLSILATLVPEGAGTQNVQAEGRSAKSQKLMSSKKPVSAATPVLDELGAGIAYRVVVYDSVGTYVDDIVYTYGDEETQGGFTLDGETDYTFVAYSTNSTSVPDISGSTLSSASVDNVSGDLMYFKKEMTIRKGDNFLDVILKHQFSQITTTISLSEDTDVSVGDITAIGTTTISPTHSGASIKLSDGTLTYNGSETEATVNFPSLGTGVRSVTASPTLLIAPATTSAEFIISSITADGMTRDLLLDDISITPGVRYNLNLAFFIPCTEVVGVAAEQIFNWAYAAGDQEDDTIIEHVISAPNADFGFVFDITILDNSFGMRINGTDLVTHAEPTNLPQVQFQSSVDDSPLNIQFADGDQYGGDVDQIYQITGTADKPIIRVVISPDGKVSMYGSKESEGDLYPLVLTSGYTFNNVTWNADAANEVVVTQLVTGATTMTGSGSGKQIVPCP